MPFALPWLKRTGIIEIIVAPDDGTTYEHLRESFKSPQLRIIPPGNVRGSGAGPTRNRALDASTGDYFVMLDADDLVPKTYIESLMRVALTEGAAIAPTRYVEWTTRRIVRTPPIHGRVLSLSGFGQLLASMHPLIHRSLEPGYTAGFAEDVVHDGTVIAKLGTISIVQSVSYDLRIRDGSMCSSGADAEKRIQEAYARRIHQIQSQPTAIAVHSLSPLDRNDFVQLFKFRAMVSERFSRSGSPSYNAWVAGQEAELWDQFHQQQLAPLTSDLCCS